MGSNPKPATNAAGWAIGCALVPVIFIFMLCSGMCNGPVQSDAEKQAQYEKDRLDLDRYRQDQLKSEDEDKARDELLKQGHTPEETEKIIGAVKDYQKEKSGSGSYSK
jgi:uncharacterized membrane-anchored protein YhcB (DUF1043 family)